MTGNIENISEARDLNKSKPINLRKGIAFPAGIWARANGTRECGSRFRA